MAIATPTPWTAGTHFSTYQIDSLLATGGMAEVWRAKMKGFEGFEKRVVIKTMLTNLQHRPELVQMFVNEASLAARLSHPNIVDVFDFGELEGRYFIAMAYVPGLTLRAAHKRTIQRGTRLPIAAALHIMRDLCEALQHIHDLEDGSGPLGLVHRDVSPDNLILSTSGSAKLIDFGAARATSRTPPGRLFVGRYRYAAPERIRQEGEDRRSDLYSVGVMLYECLTGVRPFDGTDAEVIRAVTSSRECDPRKRMPELPASVAELVKKATAHDPRDRFANARDLGAALARCLLQVGASSKEQEVTAALSAVLEPDLLQSGATQVDGVPEAIEGSRPSDPEMALSEREIIEASGPIRKQGTPEPITANQTERISLPLPPEAFPPLRPELAKSAPGPGSKRDAPTSRSGAAVRQSKATPPPTPGAARQERAVELFDLGIALRAAHRYGEALEAWERALALAPDNVVYQANVLRLREQLGQLQASSR
jgi:eukaryotic-like serine/threonine-protein kinase